ncbi:MAG: hypothetical protein HQK76_06050 [Desulfobacterales bacterium]|nr:hypothetical protein [Desulfobacterales bacterium]
MKKIFLSIFILLILLNNAYCSNFGDTYGFSPVGVSMGNAMTAIADDWSSVYYNISGLGKTPKQRTLNGANVSTLNELAVSIIYTKPSFYIDIARDGIVGADDLDFSAFVLGVAVDLNHIYKMPSIISTARLGVGLGAIQGGYAARVNDVDLKTHNFLRYGREAQRTMILTGTGFGFFEDMFGVGMGVSMNFGGEGKTKLSNVTMTIDEQIPEAQSKMDMTMVPTLVAGFYFRPEKIFPAVKGLEFGFAYREENYMEIYPFENAAHMKTGNLAMYMTLAIFDYYSPDILSIGAGYTWGDTTVSADLEKQCWSNFRVSSTNTIKYQYEDNEEITEELSGKSTVPELDDIYVIKFGLRHNLSESLSFLGGFYRQPSFVPDGACKGEINFLDNEKYVFSCGLQYLMGKKWGLGGPVELTIGYQLQTLKERSISKDDPTEYNPPYTYGGKCHTIILGTSIKL